MSRMTVANDSYGTNAVLCGTLHSLPTRTNDWLDSTCPKTTSSAMATEFWRHQFGRGILRNAHELQKSKHKVCKAKKVKDWKKLRALTERQLCFPQSISGGASETIFENGPQKNSAIHQWHSRIRIKNATFQIWFWSAQEIGIGNGISF